MALSPEKGRRYGPEREMEGHRRGQAALRRVLEQGIAAGVFRDLPLDLASEFLLCAISGFIDHMARQGDIRPPEAIVPGFVAMTLHGVKR